MMEFTFSGIVSASALVFMAKTYADIAATMRELKTLTENQDARIMCLEAMHTYKHE